MLMLIQVSEHCLGDPQESWERTLRPVTRASWVFPAAQTGESAAAQALWTGQDEQHIKLGLWEPRRRGGLWRAVPRHVH